MTYMANRNMLKVIEYKGKREKKNGGANRIRTGGTWFCRPLPYHLATAPSGGPILA